MEQIWRANNNIECGIAKKEEYKKPECLVVYEEVKNIINTPSSCWKELPVWLMNAVRFYSKNTDSMDYVYTRLGHIILISGDIDETNPIKFRCTDQFDNTHLCVIVNYKYYLQEMNYKDYIYNSKSIFKYIIDYSNQDSNFKDHIPYILTIQLIKDTSSSCTDIDKLIDDIGLSKIMSINSKHKDLLELCKQLDDPINELIVNNGLYNIL